MKRRRVKAAGRCGSEPRGKLGFKSKLDALSVLAYGKGGCRAYECPKCGWWHTTSRERWRD